MGHTGLARRCLAHWCYRTRTKPAEVGEDVTVILKYSYNITQRRIFSHTHKSKLSLHQTHVRVIISKR
nr:MAG TPA: hypothetical protein [Caudoviricetes sp.]